MFRLRVKKMRRLGWLNLGIRFGGEAGQDIKSGSKFCVKSKTPLGHKQADLFADQLPVAEREIMLKEPHKPSERFMRRPLKARSRASGSERVRLADLTNKLVNKMDAKAISNAQTQFSGYKPGHNDTQK